MGTDMVARSLASVMILAVLGLQTLVGLDWISSIPHMRHRKGYYWPFLDYPMYKGRHVYGELLDRHVIIGTLADGIEVAVTPATLGLNFWKFEKGPVRAILEDDGGRLQSFVEAYERRHGQRLLRLRLENHPWVFEPRGAVEAPRQVVKEVRLTGDARP